ncbi:MAG TPA: translation initiation factor IF-2 [Anaerohalosphaeraceae bacterium]|nr:translation initiation factor IF-2 [Anaerohalosphaeraceae bacterium]HOL88271.1 translation initiation factor IF-2 [Anaerohalosphaeraceae bacterium]
MAKAVTKVYLLAKELGVKSQAIVAKCQAEGLDIKTHMSPLTAGQVATIREWFSEGEHTTSVETAARVDLEKVRVPRRKKVTAPPEEVAAAPAAPAETSESVQAAEAPAETKEMPETETVPVSETAVPEQAAPVVPATAASAEPTVIAEPPAPQVQETPMAAPPPPPPPPEPILPAGPKLEKPTPAQLTGPTVIRVEKPEVDSRRFGGKRPRPPMKGPEKPVQPLIPVVEDDADTTAKKPKDKTHGRRKHHGEDEEERLLKGTPKRIRERDLEERRARLAAAEGEWVRNRPPRRIETKSKTEEAAPPVERPAKAVVTEPILVKDLSAALGVKTSDIIAKLLAEGVIATANQAISVDTAELIAMEFGTELVVERKRTVLEQIEKEFEQRPRLHLQKRPPIVTMLGHVDHGKTSLLDRIRKTSVAAGEAGGITQHIGAYQVEINGKRITFLDTPGHEAFTSMRARGAQMTDIVVLVVAADDGVMPQTVEAIHHAKAAGVEILVALNKIDLPGIDLHRIYGQLAEHELTPAEWGGNTEIVKTSAVTGQGIEDLIEHLDYIAELKNYQADPTLPATGWVVEAKMAPSRGAVATLLIKEGELKKGDIVLAGGAYGRVRTITDSWGHAVKKATPSMPVEITGLDGVPQAGDKFYCLSDINRAQEAAEEIRMLSREESLARRSQVTLDNLFKHIEAGKIKELNLIVRADVQGSVDVLVRYLTELSTPEVKVKVIHAGVGGITEGDVVLAQASDAIIIGFNVVPEDRVRQMAEAARVDIRLYNVIYRITEDLKAAMKGLLEPVEQEKTLGRLVVRNTFKISGVGTVAGCFVENGVVTKNAKLRLIRNNIVVKDNCAIESLRHFKDDVREVKAGLECGIKIAGFDDVKTGDVLEAYEIVQVARDL